MDYLLVDNNGVTTIEMDIIIPLKTFFITEYGLFKSKSKEPNFIVCERFFNSQFFDFYNELNDKFIIKLNKDGFIIVDMFNEPFNYEKYLIDDGSWDNQELFKILNKYPSLKDIIYFQWKNSETAMVVFDHCNF
jgi:hypothetical protein